MWLDISNLRTFYSTPLGNLTKDLLCEQVSKLWPDVSGQRVLLIGYGIPLGDLFAKDAERLLYLMPKQQGVIHWPTRKNNSVLLSDENKLPFGDNSLDRVLLLHSIEFANPTHPMLRDVWRVLAAGGKLMVVAPNRGGLWTRLERTPFGHGQPYSVQQLNLILQDAVFLPERVGSALYVPPSSGNLLQRLARPWEKLGRRYFRLFSGVILVEAEKRVYLPTELRANQKVRSPGWHAISGNSYQESKTSSASTSVAESKNIPCAPNKFSKG